MRDKRSVDELSVAELERILAIRRREERQERARQMGRTRGRHLPAMSPVDATLPQPEPIEPEQHEAAETLEPVEPPTTYDITDDIPRFEDEIEAMQSQRERKPRRAHAAPAAPATGPRPRARWDRLLLLVEVVAVVGIVTVLVYGGYLIMDENDRIEALEEKSAIIQQEAIALQATATPLPDLHVDFASYVLPGGHTYQDGQAMFNIEELPESIQPQAIAQLYSVPQQSVAERTVFAPEAIDIPAIDVNTNIYGGDDWFTLQKGVGHFQGSVNPGEKGNMVLTAHNDIYGEIFRDLELLKPGDVVRVMARNNRWYTYVVEETLVVEPDDVWVLQQGNDYMTTLITCYPYRVDTQRFIVFARLVDESAS